MRPDKEEFLGVDVGQAQVGVARGSSPALLAEPLLTIPAAESIERLSEIAVKHKSDAIVVGLPRGLNGQETDQTQDVRRWAEQARNAIGIPFYWQDEALTSREAAARIDSLKSKNQKHDEHNLAAAIILQDFLDTPAKNRVEI